MTEFARRGTVAALLAVSLIVGSHRAQAARQAQRPQPPPGAPQAQLPPAALQAQMPPASAARVVAPADADQTREALRQILDRYPQTVGRVLALDPDAPPEPGVPRALSGVDRVPPAAPRGGAQRRRLPGELQPVLPSGARPPDPGHSPLGESLHGHRRLPRLQPRDGRAHLAGQDARGLSSLVPAVEGADRGAQQTARPVHEQRGTARLHRDPVRQTIPRVGADHARHRVDFHRGAREAYPVGDRNRRGHGVPRHRDSTSPRPPCRPKSAWFCLRCRSS